MITSIKNDQVKQIISLLTKNKERKKTGFFVVEGIKMISEIPEDWDLHKIFMSQSFYEENTSIVEKLSQRVTILTTSDSIFKSMTDTVSPQGILAIVKRKESKFEDIFTINNPIIVLCEDIQDPGNLGTIIRTADAGGVNGIILSKGTVDLYNPKVIRSTMGSLFHIPIIYQHDIVEAIKELKNRNIRVLAAHLKAKEYIYDMDMLQGIAIMIGNEGNGLSKETANLADEYIKIPMLGQAESLNASVATSIIIYESVRQRNSYS